MPPKLNPLPPLSQLPLNEGDPPYSAWGLWEGHDSSLGSLNYLTDEIVLKTLREEVRTGARIGLDLPLDFFNPPLLGRAGFEQKVIDKAPLVVNDDIITFNTQGSSQWDSLRHFAYQKDQKFYNGATQQDIHAAPRTSVNDLQGWTIAIDHFSPHGITVDVVKAIADESKIEFQPGDVLFLRTGYVDAYRQLLKDRRIEVAGVREWCGLAQSRETTEWLWERQFAAVACDAPGFEVRPPNNKAWHLHPILLAGWGTPIGELFALDALADACRAQGKFSFFFTSAPLNYSGAVASPPNAVAIL
uniref:Cyclase n=1 Tax=Bionectria ochroleuca TaxID=29856 RepID=A0A8H7NBP4_BIOOC